MNPPQRLSPTGSLVSMFTKSRFRLHDFEDVTARVNSHGHLFTCAVQSWALNGADELGEDLEKLGAATTTASSSSTASQCSDSQSRACWTRRGATALHIPERFLTLFR